MSDFARFSLRDVLMVGLVVLAASLFGILTRPIGFLSAFWPANALLLGLMMRDSRLSTVFTWSAAGIGFVAADLMTGNTVILTLWLSAANIVGAFGGWVASRYVPEAHRRLERPASIFYLLAVSAAGAAAASVVGFGAAPQLVGAAPQLVGAEFGKGFAFWLSSELVSYVVILPVVLTAPGLSAIRAFRFDMRRFRAIPTLAPAVSLLASIVVSYAVGGPGSLAIPVPALLWCALSYNVFTTAMLTVVLCGYLMIAFTDGFVAMGGAADFVTNTISVRVGVALLALAPLAVASINSARNDLLHKLDFAASHDHLTGLLTRGALVSQTESVLRSCENRGERIVVLMLDLDHFKKINDQYGHDVGDRVLVAFAAAARATLRSSDLFARVGGEEFVAVLPNLDKRGAMQIAERMRATVAALDIAVEGREAPRVTVSIGIASGRPQVGFERMVSVADRALYRAKESGRDRVVVATVAVTAAKGDTGKLGVAA